MLNLPHMRALLSGVSPIALASFLFDAGDYTTLSTLSSLPTGLSVSRAGNAMVTDSSGTLTWAANNLLTYSNTFSNSAWAKTNLTAASGVSDPFGGTDAWTLTATANNGYTQQTYTGNGSTAINSIWIRRRTGSGTVWVSTPNNVNTVASLTGAWQQLNFRSASSGTSFFVIQFQTSGDAIDVYAATSSLVTYETTPRAQDQVITTTAAYYGPRLDYYWTGSAYVPKGYLVEGAGTNLQTYSNTFTSWTASNSSISGTTTGPDGVSTSASKLIASAAYGYVISSVSKAASAITYTSSFYAKKGNTSIVRPLLANSGISSYARVTFDLDGNSGAGSVVSSASSGFTSASSTITHVGGGWYRLTITATTDTTTSIALVIGHGDTAVNGDFYYIYGAQIEANAWATSYVPNPSTGSTNRAAETLSLAGYQNRLIEAFEIDQQTGVSSRALTQPSATSPVTISGLPWGWLTSLRAYTNGYAGDPTLPAWLSVAATGNRMVYDSTGTLTWAPANLLTYSEQFDNAAWTKFANTTVTANQAAAPDGTTTADLIYPTSSAGQAGSVYRAVTTGTIVSVYAKAAGFNYLCLWNVAGNAGAAWFNLSNGTLGTVIAGYTATITSVGNGWYRCSLRKDDGTAYSYVQIQAIDANNSITPTASGTNGIYAWGAQLEPVTYQTAPRAYIPTTTAAVFKPRFDVDPATLAARGLLLEGAGSNLQINSGTMHSTGWSALNSGRATDGTLAPDGVSSFAKITVNAVTAAGTGVAPAAGVAVTSGANYTYSVYVKKGTANYVWVSSGAQSFLNRYVIGVFDLTNTSNTAASQTIGGSNGGTVVTTRQEYIGNGIYRLSVSGSMADAAVFGPIVGVANNATGNAGVSGGQGYVAATTAGTETFYAWGAQVEAGTIPTSYIPTTTASVTRSAETISAALYTTNPSIIQYRPIPAGTRARKVIDPFSGISSETNEWIESGAVYPMGTGSAYLNTKLTVDGPY